MPPSDGLCAYCKTRRGHQADHIMPKAERRRFPAWNDITVPACHECNHRKGTRRLLPPSWAARRKHIENLTGKTWKVWNGDPKAPAFTQVIR